MADPGVLQALIAAMAAVLVAIVGLLGIMLPLLMQARRHAQRADVQVSNNHSTNLREEADERHSENVEGLRALHRKVDTMAGDLRGVRRDIGRLWSNDVDQSARLTEIEHTQPKGPDYGPPRLPHRRPDRPYDAGDRRHHDHRDSAWSPR